MLPQCLKPLSQRRIRHAERQAELSLLEPQDQQKQCRPEGRRQYRERSAFNDVVSCVDVPVLNVFARAVNLTSPPAASAARKEGAVSSRRAGGAAEKRFAIERDPTSQGRQKNVVRKVLYFVGHAAVTS